MHETKTLLIVLHGHENSCVTFRGEERLQVFGNTVLDLSREKVTVGEDCFMMCSPGQFEQGMWRSSQRTEMYRGFGGKDDGNTLQAMYYNVTMWCVRVTIDAMKSSEY